jgi:predicted aspartyl protease
MVFPLLTTISGKTYYSKSTMLFSLMTLTYMRMSRLAFGGHVLKCSLFYSWILVVAVSSFSTWFYPSAGLAAECQLTKVASMPVVMQNNRMLVGGAMNGTDVLFQIDTGLSQTRLFAQTATTLNLNERLLYSASKGGRIWETVVENLTLGKVSLDHWRVLAFGNLPRWATKNVAGVLGEDFLSHFDVEFDLAHQTINLYKADQCNGASLGFWSPDIVTAEFGSGSSDLPMIDITPKINGQDVRGFLDSGSPLSAVSIAAAERLGVSWDSPETVAGTPTQGMDGRKTNIRVGVVDRFSLGEEAIKNTHLRVGDLPEKHTIGMINGLPIHQVIPYEILLGLDFINSHHVLVSHSQNKIYFSYSGGPVFQTN